MTHLQIHVKSKHEEKSESTKNQVKKIEQKIECPICRAIFGKTNLKKHIRTKHEGKKDYKCDLCGNQYFEKKRLNRHIKKEHDKIRDEKCNQCSKLFFSKEVLNRHIKNIHKHISCHLCNEEFLTKSTLVEHLNMEHPKEHDVVKDRVHKVIKKHIKSGKNFVRLLTQLS